MMHLRWLVDPALRVGERNVNAIDFEAGRQVVGGEWTAEPKPPDVLDSCQSKSLVLLSGSGITGPTPNVAHRLLTMALFARRPAQTLAGSLRCTRRLGTPVEPQQEIPKAKIS
jgi:hypothetical protein